METITDCIECGNEIPKDSQKRGAYYCSDECRRKHLRKLYYSKNSKTGFPTGLPSGTVGAMSELKVAVDLLSRGYGVFRALSPSSPCDLAILQDSKLIKVEVKTGHYTSAGKVFRPYLSNHNYDILALVMADDKIIYEPSLDTIL